MNPIPPERRRTPRYSLSALAVLKTPQGPEVRTTEVMDLSLGGSRVMMDRPLQPGEEFVLIIKASGEEIVVRGVVAHSHADGVAGLSFTRMSEEARARLELLVAGLADSAAARDSAATSE